MKTKELIFFLFLCSASALANDVARIDSVAFRQYLDSAKIAEENTDYTVALDWIGEAERMFDRTLPKGLRCDFYNIQGTIFMSTWQLEKAEDSFLKGIALSSSQADSSSMLLGYSRLAVVKASQGRGQEAIKFQNMALSYFRGLDSTKYYSLLNNLAVSYEGANKPDRALRLYIRVKEYYKSKGDYQSQALVENNLGEVYRSLKGDAETAQKYYRNAIALNGLSGSKRGLMQNYHNMALTYSMIYEYDSSFYYLRKSIKLRKEAGGRGGLAIPYYALGNNYLASEQLDSAEWAFSETLSISEEMGIEPGMFYANGGLGRLYTAVGKTAKAEKHFLLALDAAEHTGSLSFKQSALRELYDFYKSVGNSAAALKAYENFQSITDSMRTVEKQRELDEIMAKYEVDLAEAENQTLRAEQGLREAQITRQRWFLVGLIVLLVLLVAGWAILVRAYRQRNQAFVEVVEAKRELQVQYDRTKEQELKLLEAASLKNRIFSVLGHDLRAPLSNISSMLGLVSADTISEEELNWIFRHLRHDTDQSINTLNNILQWSQLQMSDLRVQREKVEIKGAFSDLKEIFESSTRLKNINLTFEDHSESGKIWVDPNQFRSIATNLISNAIKFSPVGEVVKVGISENERFSVLQISDNGDGFPDNPLPISGSQKTKTTAGTLGETGTGVGLQIVRDFVEAHQGKIAMSKLPEGGALIEVYLPRSQSDATQGAAAGSRRIA